jgi:subtilisin family serine protease
MPPKPALFDVVLLALCFAWPALAADGAAPSGPRVLRVEEHRERAQAIGKWDPQSPQRLVRIDGAIYQEDRDHYFPVVPGRITVRLAEGVKSWDELVARAVGGAPDTFRVLSELKRMRVNRLGIVDLEVPEGSDLAAWCELVHRSGLVRYAEVATSGSYTATQNDPRYPEQWALDNTGQTGGTPGADIDAERVWDLTAGSPSIVVAILDSGTDIDHEDLAANVWHNEGEIPNNGSDDDGNGYVDDWEGWDFDGGDNDPRPSFYHGTHVTGIVNAVGSNGVGIAGLAGGLGGPGVRGMALGVGTNAPNGSVLDDAILYAADNGAHVITISLDTGETQAINDALDYAYNTKDVFIDCAAGNSGSSVGYPANRPEVMAVGSTDHRDDRSSFSNPGPEVEVAAPGSNILSTGIGDTYATNSGTSFAAPYVAGLAALIRSRNSGLSAADVRQLIIDSAEDVEDPGFDELTGHGRINAFDAVSLAATSNGTLVLDASAYACNDVVGSTVSDIDLAGAGTLSIDVTSETESGGESVILTESGPGSGLFRGSVAIAEGLATEDGVLQVADGDTIVAEYLDADDGQGGTDVVKTETAPVDCTAPTISDVVALNVTNTSATIAWNTDEPANSVVRYGPVTPPAQQSSVSSFVTQHAVSLGGLAECTIYKFDVESQDPQANVTFDDNAGAYYTFETHGTFPDIGIIPCHQGQVRLDRDGDYGCDDTAGVTVTDLDLNSDSGAVETASALVTTTSEPAGEWIVVTELTADSSQFIGSIAIHGGPAVADDGMLALSPGDLITATYYDADDGQGGSWIATDTATADCTAPRITNLRISESFATLAVVEWDTDEPATSRVEFGSSPALGNMVEQTELVTAHRLSISPFQACDRAYFRVSSMDAFGDVRIADAGGEPLALNLKQIGGLVYYDNFESDTGWQLPGDWERGTPQGLGSQNGDPVSAWSGSWSIGNDLSGQGAFPGDYEPTTSSSAISPVFSTRQERDLELIIRRKLGVTSADEAGIYVITGGTGQVWTSNYQVNDTEWVQRTYNISALADNQDAVQLEFRIESSDADHSFGWNLDEIIVKDSTVSDYLSCGGCAGAPGFGGVTAVYDPEPCGPGGLVIEWAPASSWGTGSSGSYDVYRGTSSTFVPDASNRVASGLTGTTWADTGAPVATPVWYVVRARNNESCSGGEGLSDSNLVRIEGIETTALSLPAPVGASLATAAVGSAHVRLEWAPAAGADHYLIRRGESPDFSDAVEVGTTSSTGFEDFDAATAPVSYSYRVFAVDACNREE